MKRSNLFADLAFVTISDSARYALVKDEPGGSWRVERNGEMISHGHHQKWEARIAALKTADKRLEIAILEGEQ